MLLLAASRAVDGVCNRFDDGFVAEDEPSARIFVGAGSPWLTIRDEFSVAPTLVRIKSSVTDTAYSITLSGSNYMPFAGGPEKPNYNKLPYGGLMIMPGGVVKTFPSGMIEPDEGWFGWENTRPQANVKQMIQVPTVEITAQWGYAVEVPSTIKQATITVAARWFKRGQSFWADTIASSNFDMMNYRKVLDPDVEMMLKLARMVRPLYA
jgi:hypothetical protein